MKLKDLIDKLDWYQVKETAFYLGYSSKEIINIGKVLDSLKETVPNENSEDIFINMSVDAFYEINEEKMHVYGFSDYEEEIDISFYKWEDWLNFSIDKDLLNYLSEEEILIYCLKEMSIWGLTNFDVLVNTGQDSFNKKGKEKLIHIFNKVGE